MRYGVAGPERSRCGAAPVGRFGGRRWRSSLCLGVLIAAHPGAAALAGTAAKSGAQKNDMQRNENVREDTRRLAAGARSPAAS